MRRRLRVATLEEILHYGRKDLPRGLVPPIGGGAGYYASMVLNDGPRAYWRMDASAGTSETDLSGNALTGAYATVSGSAPLLNQAGLLTNDPDASAQFNNSTNRNYFTYQNNPFSTNPPTTFTIEFWFKANGGQGTARQYLVCQDNGGTVSVENVTWFTIIEASTNIIVAGTQYAAGTYAQINQSGGPNVNDGSPHHCVFTYEGVGTTITPSKERLYLDGALVASASSLNTNWTPIASGTSWMLGATAGGGAKYLFGNLDEIALYEKVLNASQIATHYAVGQGYVFKENGAFQAVQRAAVR